MCVSLNKASFIEVNGTRVPNKRLTYYSLLQTLRTCRHSTFVFHQRSALPYLVIMWIFKTMFRLKCRLIYDCHDLLESPTCGSFREYMRWRYYYALEMFAFSVCDGVMTVSNGLQRFYSMRFKRRPHLVMSIPGPQLKQQTSQFRRNVRLLYFGQIRTCRIDIELLSQLERSGLRLDLYGTYSHEHAPAEIEPFIRRGVCVYKGKFLADDLSFLDDYTHLVMRLSGRRNIKYCLPNKLFQALRSGLAVIISDNLVEVRRLLRWYEYTYLTLQSRTGSVELANLKPISLKESADVNQFLDALHLSARGTYMELTHVS